MFAFYEWDLPNLPSSPFFDQKVLVISAANCLAYHPPKHLPSGMVGLFLTPKSLGTLDKYT